MNLDYGQIVTITTGAVSVEQCSDGIKFHRFTKEQEAYYVGMQFHPKENATAGVRLCFRTDSKTLALKVKVSQGSGRKYFAHDVLVDGKLIGCLENFKEDEMVGNYVDMDVPFGEFRKEFSLDEGVKTVCIHFPWSVCSVLQEMSLDDGALVEPVKKSKKLIAFGDSITHGYDARHPSNRYIAKLADALDAEEFCKAIGGEIHCPGLAKLCDEIKPDYITVAYGTNDWNGVTAEVFKANCQSFYEALVHNYPDARIFTITPIWRKECQEERPFGRFEDVEEIISDIVKDYKNITCIRGRKVVPEDENLYGDLHLHPNDEGFEYYYQGVVEQVQLTLHINT